MTAVTTMTAAPTQPGPTHPPHANLIARLGEARESFQAGKTRQNAADQGRALAGSPGACRTETPGPRTHGPAHVAPASR